MYSFLFSRSAFFPGRSLSTNTSSLSSVLSARSAISFYWKLKSSLDCPTESQYVSLLIKVISRKYKSVPKKAYPISYKGTF